MTIIHDPMTLLRRAVQQPISALTAAEVESPAQAADVIASIRSEIKEDRPFAEVYFSGAEGAGALQERCKMVSRHWLPEIGVLAVIDEGGLEDTQTRQFWSGMNALRESWANIRCHVVFFLSPYNYRMMTILADHLADWMPLKLRFSAKYKNKTQYGDHEKSIKFSGDIMSPSTAKNLLKTLEPLLIEALEMETNKKKIISRFYLPMFEAAIALNDIRRAYNLRQNIQEKEILKGDVPDWWRQNFILDMELFDLKAAEIWTNRLFQWAEKTGNSRQIAESYYQFGIIAKEQQDFNTAEKWFRKALTISEKQGQSDGIATTYHVLGSIALAKEDLNEASKWYSKSAELNETLGNDAGLAMTYHQLGNLEHKRQDYDVSEKWYKKALETKEKLCDEYGVAITYHQLGVIAHEKMDFSTAKELYSKALEIKLKYGNERGAAKTYGQLGILAAFENRSIEAAEWIVKCALIYAKYNDSEGFQLSMDNLLLLYNNSSELEKEEIQTIMEKAGFGDSPVSLTDQSLPPLNTSENSMNAIIRI